MLYWRRWIEQLPGRNATPWYPMTGRERVLNAIDFKPVDRVPIDLGGIGIFPVICMTEPDFVAELHEMVTRNTVEQLELILSEIGPYIDIYFLNGDDWGTQDQSIMPPRLYKSLFLPYYKRMNDAIHRSAPGVRSFLHSCGAIYDLLDMIVESGFDVLNPVQWTAGGHSYREWKDRTRGRIALWGGGVDSQHVLPLGAPEEVTGSVREIVDYLAADSGFVCCSVQNILAGVPAENVVAMYRAAYEEAKHQ